MRLDRRDRHIQLARDLLIGQSPADRLRDLHLAVCQRGELALGGGASRLRRTQLRLGDGRDQLRRHAGGEHRLAVGDCTDRFHQARRRGVLEQETRGARAQRLEHQVIGVEGRQHQNPRRIGHREDRLRRAQAVTARHPNVHQDDIGPVLGDDPHRVLPIDRLGNDCDAGVAPEDQP